MNLPDTFKDKKLIAIFNIEADRGDDLLYDPVYLNSLRLQIEHTLKTDIAVVLLVPKTLTETFSKVFEADLLSKSAILITTDAPHQMRFETKGET
mmetsp:Transcript_40315/g.52791  ORF Transcript_40315/g.52791 Transcript_40315/m.52791 type:complete len:95 (-) Transcript_40315:574-858(-)